MKFILTFFLLLVLNCQPKISTDSKSQNNTPEFPSIPARDTIIQSVKNSQVSKSHELHTITNKIPEQIKPSFVEADAGFQQEANEKLTKLLKHYGENMPDYFGGGFIDEKGNLVINIKGNLVSGKAKISHIIGSENVIFQNTKYSNKELIAIMDYLNDFAQKPENKKYTANLSAWSQMENYIEVCFIKMNENSEADFRKYILDSEAIRFKECGRIQFQ